MEKTTLYYRLKSMTDCRALLDRPVMAAAANLLGHLLRGEGEWALEEWGKLVSLLEWEGAASLGDWLERELRYLDSPWARGEADGSGDAALEAAARRDIETLTALAQTPGSELREELKALLPGGGEAVDSLPLWCGEKAPFSFESLREGYRADGTGLFAQYRAFLWDAGRLIPVEKPDAPGPEELVGYRFQRKQVEDNTYALLAGRRVNNVLLYGESGTGKSATVKSLLALPGAGELRLIEIEKNGMDRLPALIRSLNGRRQKFILFIDDLAFDEDDMGYSVLKTILEGGLEARGDNVAIYATSNRRNLVRQTFSARMGDDVDREETIQEKTALADRFGLRIRYQGLEKGEYLELVELLARKKGCQRPLEELHALAVRWDVRHPGRSPRTAQQFVDSL